MKEFNVMEPIKILEGKISVTPYLTYTQIQAIVNEVCKFDLWSEREQSIDIMLLHFATDLTDEEIERVGHDTWVQSGVLNKVKNNVKNFDQIYDAIEYTQSTQRALAQILKEIPDIMKPLKGAIKDATGKK